MTRDLPSEEALIADLKATFPGIHARPLREFGAPGREYPCGVWAGADGTAMPDELPIFSTLACSDPDHYDGNIHVGFLAWLQARGWYVESYDGGTHFIVPLPSEEEVYGG